MQHENEVTTAQSPVDESLIDKHRRRAIAASGIGWGLDGFTWTMYGFALTAAMPVLGMSSGASGWVTAISIVASAAVRYLWKSRRPLWPRKYADHRHLRIQRVYRANRYLPTHV